MLPTHVRRGGAGQRSVWGRGAGGGGSWWGRGRGWWVTWGLGCLVLFTLAAPLLFLDLSQESRARLGNPQGEAPPGSVEDVEQPPPPPPPPQHAKEEEQISNTKKQQKQQNQKPEPEPHRDDEPAPKDDHGEEAEPEEEEETRPQQQQQQQLEEEGGEDSADDEIENEKRREAVKGAFLHAWNSYVRHAWGFDELQPLSRSGKDWLGQGITILDSLDTLLIMGLDHEFQRARAWVRDSLRWDDKERMVSTFETTIRNLGGLLSAYGLTGDELFLEKAKDLGSRLLRAFQADDLMPKAAVGLVSGRGKNPSWTGGKAILSEVGSIQMEFLYLAKAARNASFAEKPSGVMDVLDQQGKIDGLYPIYLDGHSGKLSTSSKVTLGALGDSFFEYLLKLWLLADKRIPKYQRMYDEAARGVLQHMTAHSEPNKFTYLAELHSPQNSGKIPRMDHLVCFAGGMFALGAAQKAHGALPEDNAPFMELGEQLTATCHETYKRSPSGIGPEVIEFNPRNNDDFSSAQKAYLLRPETVESYFILWRLTHDRRYREWGWEAFQAIERHCRHHVGYAGLRDVDSSTPEKDDTQQSFFLAETLKYLFLLFSDDDVIPLDQYVFNTEAHPLPIFKDAFADWKGFTGSPRFE